VPAENDAMQNIRLKVDFKVDLDANSNLFTAGRTRRPILQPDLP
jgi:hypothetical protein